MALKKVTFSLDSETIARLETTAERLRQPKSQVVREAIADYAARADRLSEMEKIRLLRALDESLDRIPDKPAAEVDRELEALREARQAGGRGGE